MKNVRRETTGRQGRWSVSILEGDRGAVLLVVNGLSQRRYLVPADRGTEEDLLSALQMAIDQREFSKASE